MKKTIQFVGITMAILLVLMSFSSSIYAGYADYSQPPEIFDYDDLNGDGIIDVIYIDWDGDGNDDFVFRDLDFDGTFDTIEWDANDDGILEIKWHRRDTDGDGIFDYTTIQVRYYYIVDRFGNRHRVVRMTDMDGDGIVDMVEVDTDGDGFADKFFIFGDNWDFWYPGYPWPSLIPHPPFPPAELFPDLLDLLKWWWFLPFYPYDEWLGYLMLWLEWFLCDYWYLGLTGKSSPSMSIGKLPSLDNDVTYI